MIDGKSIAIVIPCYNEECGLWTFLGKTPDFVDEVIVVNNCSTNGTAKVADWFQCTVLHELVRGYGSAYKRGFAYVNKDIIVAMDGDATYPFDGLRENIQYLIDNDLDFVCCSRFPLTHKHSMSRVNYFGNKVLSLIARLMFNTPVSDIASGMWIFKRDYLKYRLWFYADDMRLTIDIKLMRGESKVGERHIDYRPRVGKCKQRWLKDGMGYLLRLLELRLGL